MSAFLDIARGRSPLVLSVPHAGTEIPDDIAARLVSRDLGLKDTDWWIDRLYAPLAEALDATLPADWPPEHHDDDVLSFMRERLAEADDDGWWLHYVVLTDDSAPMLAGTAGYKGPPRDGVVEIGYSVVPSFQRRGIATEASKALVWMSERYLYHSFGPERKIPPAKVLETLGTVWARALYLTP
jgi:GNAT superfamily N-acetyltransferase